MTPCRFLLDPPGCGAWNMAVDEALLESAAEKEVFSFRIYRWEEPTLSLGYFQAYQSREQHTASAACPAVRRTTGGGAIVHDREITYSLALPASHSAAKRHLVLYEAVHGSLIAALSDWSVSARLCRAADAQEDRHSCLSHLPDKNVRPPEPDKNVRPPQASSSPPFLCFQRRAPGDVLVGPAKIAGSAQRRLRGAVLQHGSILWTRSAAAPELPGLNEAATTLPPEEQFLDAWCRRMAERLRLQWQRDRLSETERRRAEELRTMKYAADAWNRSR
jgi:lipoate-protein ligase A